MRDCWGLVPAAGAGRRMGAGRPKQYLDLDGRTVLEHAVARLAAHPRIQGIVVCVAPGDPYWARISGRLPKLLDSAPGGGERAESVHHGLQALGRHCRPEDWVLVHDAARPCLRPADVERLIREAESRAGDGALLAAPLADTVKRAGPEGEVLETVPREGLWRALTPQIFPFRKLIHSIENALRNGLTATDEASAVEARGGRVRLVAGHPDNIKITHMEDLELSRAIIAAQARTGADRGPGG